MGSVKNKARIRIVGIVCALALFGVTDHPRCAWAGGPVPDATFARTASEKLTRGFSSPDVSFILYDIGSDRYIASKWIESDKAVPIGSLGKPFTALAYAEGHNYQIPEHECAGGSACWLPKGHGRLSIARAVAFSCNAYFTELARNTGGAQVTTVAQRFGLRGPGVNASPEVMAGRFGVWRESPAALVRAYATLLGRRLQPGIREIVDGMEQSARIGTAAGVSHDGGHPSYIAKTGTAPCVHKERAPGDGFVIVSWPSQSARYLLLVRQHGVPGAQAAVLAGRMLRELER